MLEEVEKRSYMIAPCLITKELISKIGEVFNQLDAVYILKGKTKDIKTDTVDLFVGIEWPSRIQEISIQSSGPLGKINIDLHFDANSGNYGQVEVQGSDVTWVEGVAKRLKDIFEGVRSRYYPIVEYWPVRTFISAFVMLLVVWRVNHSLWYVISEYINLSEISFFLAVFLVLFCLSAYHLNRFLVWMFPRYEFQQSVQRKIRKYLAAVLALLITWILTERFFPALIP